MEALERKREKEAQQEEAIEHSPVSTQLPKQISHSLERIVSVQPRDSMAVLQKPPTQADVLMNESVLDGPSLESGEKEGSLGESNAEALMPVRTEAGRHDVSNEELQPSDGNPPLGMKGTLENNAPRKKPVRKPREEQLDLAKEQ